MHRLAFFIVVYFASVTVVAWSAEEESPEALLQRAGRASQDGNAAEAVRLATAAIAFDNVDPMAYRLRGREHFRLGNVDKSIADFDRCAELQPNRQTSLWERGISYYYGGRYVEGAKQFEDYQTYHSEDVENAVWHVLCNSKVKDYATAKQNILSIRRDRRVPMMTIYDLFRGQARPEDVIQRATAESGDAALFYAHLYVGLYHEARGEAEKAREHISTAAEKYRIGHYMWDVARVHAERFKHDTPSKPEP